MRCNKVSRNLSAYRDGELSKEDAQLVEEHLRECPNCTEKLTWHRWIAHVLSSIDFSDEPSQEIFEKIRRRIRDTIQEEMKREGNKGQ